MKITFPVPELQKRLGQLGAVVARKSPEPIYGHVRVFTDDKGIVCLQGIDVDSTFTNKLPGAKADGPANILVEYQILNALVQSFKAPSATLAYATEQEAIISCGKFKGRLKGWPTEQFMALPVVQGIAEKPALGGYTFGLPGLKEQVEQVDFATPPADGKFVVASALIASTADTLSVVGTDGVVIAVSSTPSTIGEFSFTVPKPALELLKKLDGGTTVTISDTEGLFFFETEIELFTYSKTHAEFPPYHRHIPKTGSFPTCFVAKDKTEFQSALKQVKILCGGSEEKDAAPVDFAVAKDGTEVTLKAVYIAKVPTGDIYTDMADSSITVESSGVANKAKVDANRLEPFIERAIFPVTIFIRDGASLLDMHANGGTQDKPTYRFLMMAMRDEGGPSSTPLPQID